MAASVTLLQALQDRRLFRAGQPLARDQGATPSDFVALDDALPWNGFPRGALTEILLPHPGIGEIELIASAWRRIGAQERLVFVAPPCVPYAPGLRAAGIRLPRFAWIDTDAARAPWAAEQCLRAGCLGAVALWFSGGDDRSLRRLQLAAEEGACHGFVFRPLRHAANASPAALRLQIDPEPSALRVRVLKCRGAMVPTQALRLVHVASPAGGRGRAEGAGEGGATFPTRSLTRTCHHPHPDPLPPAGEGEKHAPVR